MPRLLCFLIFTLIVANFSYAEILKKNPCIWDNEFGISCLEIKANTYNSSKFSNSGINKIIITKKQIEDSGAVDLIDIFKTSSDINITQSGPKGQQASMFMRGTGSNHVLVMINGIPINDQSTTQGLHDFGVDFIQTIQQIEIYPGSSATHFGTNAIGGAINIIMTGDYKNSLSIVADKDLNYEFFGNRTFVSENSSLNFKLGSVRHETISARGTPDDEKDELRNYTINTNYENYINFNKRIFSNIYLRQTIAEYDNSNSNQTGYEGDNRMGTFHLGFEDSSKANDQKYVFYYNIYNREYDERGTIDTYESEVIGLKYNFSKTLDEKFSFGIGSEYKYDWGYFDNNGSYQAETKGHSDNISLYGNFGYNIYDQLNFSFFGRDDKHKYTGNSITYKLNLEHKLNSSKFGISYMEGLRNPTLYEMFGTDNFGYSGNRDLQPEKSNTIEVYSNLSINENLKFSVRGFKSSIENNIEYINNKYRNDNDDIDLNQSGINFNVNFYGKSSYFKFFSSFLSTKKENESDQLRRPEKNYGLDFSYKFKNEKLGDFDLNILYNHYGKHLDTHSSNFSVIEMDSTDIFDIKLEKEIKNSKIFLKINNLLNEYYQRPHGYNQEGRMIKVGYKY